MGQVLHGSARTTATVRLWRGFQKSGPGKAWSDGRSRADIRTRLMHHLSRSQNKALRTCKNLDSRVGPGLCRGGCQKPASILPLCFMRNNRVQLTLATAGIFQVPSKIEGAVSFGQYILSIRMNSPFGAGSQLACLSAPGDAFWK